MSDEKDRQRVAGPRFPRELVKHVTDRPASGASAENRMDSRSVASGRLTECFELAYVRGKTLFVPSLAPQTPNDHEVGIPVSPLGKAGIRQAKQAATTHAPLIQGPIFV